MIIKKDEKEKKSNSFSFVKFLYIYFFLSLVPIFFFAVAVFQSQLFINEKNKFLDYFSKAGRYEYLYLPNIIFKAIKSNFYNLEKIDLEIKFEEILILENLRKEAISNGKLPESSKMPKIKTKIVYDKKKYDADIRLKGDRKAHYIDKEKSSYKLELDREQFIFGIKKFAIQKPRLRNYIHEWIFHELSKDEGIIKIKYDFVNLTINNENKGLYVIEEGFGKELIERNKRRNGPIFGLDEDIYGLYDNPVFEIYNKKYWNMPENNSIANVASQKLHDFFNNKSNIEEVFDLKKWAAYFAIIDLTANYHGALLKSVKLYYNPLNGLFEPIPFDGHRLKPNYHSINTNYDNRILIDIVQNPIGAEITGFTWLKKFFFKNEKLNQNFYNLYSFYLNKISSEKYVDNFLSKNSNKIKEINSHIYADYFFYDNSRNYGVGLYYFLISDFKHHAKNIRDKLKFKNQVQLLRISDDKYLFKTLYKNYSQIVADKIKCSVKNEMIDIQLSQGLKNFGNTYLNLSKTNIDSIKCNSLVIIDKFNKKEHFLKVDYLNSKYLYKNFKKKNLRKFKNYFEQKKEKLVLKNDVIEIAEDIYIPEGYNVIVEPGQKIFLTNKAFIISNSPWHIGGKENSTLISGKKDNLGGGIFIGDTDEISRIENTKFSYLNGYNFDKNQEHIIYGSVNFHQTEVEIMNSSFENIFSEDAINIFRSDFNINNVNYSKIYSDAIDVDFSDGEIDKASFVNVNNDAIDFSGSNVDIKNVYFDNISDKIISAGENSIIYIDGMEGNNSYAGIISKDGSKVYSKNIYLDSVKIPLAAYQKKNEYDHPILVAKNYKLKNFLVNSIQDETANLNIQDETIVMKSSKIISLIYEKNFSLLN